METVMKYITIDYQDCFPLTGEAFGIDGQTILVGFLEECGHVYPPDLGIALFTDDRRVFFHPTLFAQGQTDRQQVRLVLADGVIEMNYLSSSGSILLDKDSRKALPLDIRPVSVEPYLVLAGLVSQTRFCQNPDCPVPHRRLTFRTSAVVFGYLFDQVGEHLICQDCITGLLAKNPDLREGTFFGNNLLPNAHVMALIR